MKRRTLAILLDYVARGGAGLLLAAPLTAAVAASGIAAFPEGDRLLFQPGGLLLVEVARAVWSLLPPLATSSIAVGTLLGVALLVPRATLLTALAEGDRGTLPTFLARALTRVPALLALEGFALLAQALAWSLAFAASGLVHGAPWGGSPRSDYLALSVVGLGGLLAVGLGVVRDLSSAALACGAEHSRSALRAGLMCFARSPGTAFARWLGPALLGLSLVSASALAVGELDVGRAGTLRLVAVVLAHQGAALALTLCRASWLGTAVELVRLSSLPAPGHDGRLARSGEQGDPS